MQHEEQVAVEFEDDARPEPAEAADGPAEGGVEGRVEGADEERVGDADAVEGAAGDARAEAVDVDGDVRQLGHGAMLPAPIAPGKRPGYVAEGSTITGEIALGHEVIIYGCIEGADWRPEQYRWLQQRNAAVIAELPSVDEWPWLIREMFGVPDLRIEGTYRTQVIHFGASLKDEPPDRTCWDVWLGKFEALLRRLYWYSATVHLRTDFEPHRVYVWLPTTEAVERMVADPPECIQEWTREMTVIRTTS